MTQLLSNRNPLNIYRGVPQQDKLQVYKVPLSRNVVLTQAILNNPEDSESIITLIINTQDVAVFKLGALETEIVNLYLVLNSEDYVALKQSEGGRVSVSLNGNID